MAYEFVKISYLNPAPAPLSGGELLAVVQAGGTYKLASRAFVLPMDPILTAVNMVATFPGSRYIQAGSGVTIVDGGPGQPYTISAAGGSGGAIVFNSKTVLSPAYSAVNNFNDGTWGQGLLRSSLRITPPVGGLTITGINTGLMVDGQTFQLMNVSGTESISLTHNSSSSSPSNRFQLPLGGDFNLLPNQMVMVVFETDTNSLRIVA